MNELPDKITRIDIFRIERGMRKLCQCRNPRYEIDTQNHFVTCLDCGAIVDPFVAITEIATHYDRLNNQVEALLNQAREIQNYEPHLKVIKEIEQHYRAKMVPYCPRCGESFDLAEISCWTNRMFLRKGGVSSNDTARGNKNNKRKNLL